MQLIHPILTGSNSLHKVGIPLLVMRIKHPEEYHPAQPNYEYGFNDNYPANESVEHLMAGSENEDEWMDACCVVVVRADKKPLEPQHVRALVGFIKLMDPYLTFTMADPSDMTTPGEFKEYYMDHCADEKRGTPAPSPYPHARRTTARGELSRMSTQTLMQAAESERELAMAREIGRLRRELRKAS